MRSLVVVVVLVGEVVAKQEQTEPEQHLFVYFLYLDHQWLKHQNGRVDKYDYHEARDHWREGVGG